MWQFVKNIYHLIVAFFANIWFGWPSKRLKIIGVTGTDGKTTTVHLIYHILKTARKNVSMISSIGAAIGGKEYDIGFHVTTPSSWQLQRFLKKIAEGAFARQQKFSSQQLSRDKAQFLHKRLGARQGADSENFITSPRQNFLVLEITSHALDQYRAWGIDFTAGVLTNVTHEHLDYHKTYENYVRTKAKLLRMAKVAVVNSDDRSFPIVKSQISNLKSQTNSKFLPRRQAGKIQNSKLSFDPELKTEGQGKSKKLITYGMRRNADVNPQNFPFKTKLIGEFNRYNCLAAIATCRALGVSDKDIKKGIRTFTPAIGRQEIIHDDKFMVMIDFAHTPNSFEKILPEVKKLTRGRLIHVFGCAGKRDETKRPFMGEISARYADVIILTAEDPRGEPMEKIMQEIESGIRNQESRTIIHDSKFIIHKIPDRQEAIREAIRMARKGDVVLLTGKSHERSMNYGKGEEPWSEHGAVRNALQIRSTKHEIRNKF